MSAKEFSSLSTDKWIELDTNPLEDTLSELDQLLDWFSIVAGARREEDPQDPNDSVDLHYGVYGRHYLPMYVEWGRVSGDVDEDLIERLTRAINHLEYYRRVILYKVYSSINSITTELNALNFPAACILLRSFHEILGSIAMVSQRLHTGEIYELEMFASALFWQNEDDTEAESEGRGKALEFCDRLVACVEEGMGTAKKNRINLRKITESLEPYFDEVIPRSGNESSYAERTYDLLSDFVHPNYLSSKVLQGDDADETAYASELIDAVAEVNRRKNWPAHEESMIIDDPLERYDFHRGTGSTLIDVGASDATHPLYRFCVAALHSYLCLYLKISRELESVEWNMFLDVSKSLPDFDGSVYSVKSKEESKKQLETLFRLRRNLPAVGSNKEWAEGIVGASKELFWRWVMEEEREILGEMGGLTVGVRLAGFSWGLPEFDPEAFLHAFEHVTPA